MTTLTSIQPGAPGPDGFPPAVLKALRKAINYASANPPNGSHIPHHEWSQRRCLPLALEFLKKELGVVDPPSASLKKRKRAPRKKPSPSKDDSEDSESDLTDLETEEENNSNPEPGPSVINGASTYPSTPTSQEIEQAHFQLREFRSLFQAQLDGSNLTETQKLKSRRQLEEMEEMLQDLEG